MTAALRILVVSLVLLAAPAATHAQVKADRITEAQVRTLVDKVTGAANRRDVPAIMQSMADDVVVVIDFRGLTGKRQRMKMNRAQYEAHAAATMRWMDKYSYKRQKLDIAIAKDGQTATVTSQARETYEYQGTTVVAAIEDETTLALRDGRILITEVRGYVR